MIYEFICPECSHLAVEKMTLDQYDGMVDKALSLICSECGGKMRRKFSPPSISIK